MRARQKSSRSFRGFTLVELVVVIVVIGIVAAIIVPRIIGRSGFESRGFFDQATQIVRFAQKTSIAWRRQIFVCVTGTADTATVAASTVAGCATPLTGPGGAALTATSPSGVTIAGAPFSFSFAAPSTTAAGGRPLPDPSPAQTIVITLSSTIPGDPARQIVVERETGYVHN